MSSALPSALPPVSPATPANPPAHARIGDGAADDAAPRRFSQALDKAVAAETRAPTREPGGGVQRPRAKGEARDVTQTEAGRDTPLALVQTEALPALIEDPPLPSSVPAVQGNPDAASDGPPPTGVDELLVQLRANSPAGPGARPADLAAQGAVGGSALAEHTRARATGTGTGAELATATPPADAAGAAWAPRAQAEQAAVQAGNDLFVVRLGSAQESQTPLLRSEAAASLVPIAAAAGAAAGAVATSATTAAAPAEANLPARPGSAEFGAQFGAQITTFVRAGVQHARLQLNPADLGPVSVHIQLNGQTALVHLSADHAQTRQALEQAMPQLASSLRDAGLTLTGGGVFQQPHQDRDAAPHARGSASGASAGTGVLGSPSDETIVAALRHRGVVDLVA